MAPSRSGSRVDHAAANPLVAQLRGAVTLLILAAVLALATMSTDQLRVEAMSSVSELSSSHAEDLPYRSWGTQALQAIDNTFRLPGTNGYAEEVTKEGARAPAFIWTRSVQLSALIAAARVDPTTYLPRVRQDIESLRRYWVEDKGLGGFDVLPGPKPVDRYYDDNAWMTLALLDAFDVSGDRQYLDWAKSTFRFVMSGEDQRSGGGIYWREQVKETKNTCSNAPAALGAIRLYEATGDPYYLDTGKRLYAWTNDHLRDVDFLFSDHVSLDGQVNRTKWSYNSALMIQVNLSLGKETGESAYLEQALQTARSARERWIDKTTGAIADDAVFAQHLANAFLMLSKATGEQEWQRIGMRAAAFLHDKGMDRNGHYGKNWSSQVGEPLSDYRLIDSATAAGTYWLLAEYAGTSRE